MFSVNGPYTSQSGLSLGKWGLGHTGFFRWAIIWARMLERAFRRVDWIRVVVRGDLPLPKGSGITPYIYWDDAMRCGAGYELEHRW